MPEAGHEASIARSPVAPSAGLPDSAEPPRGREQALITRPHVASRESAFERLLWRTGLTMMAVGAVVWVGCTGHFAIAVIRSQRSISRAITSLEADGFQVTREHVQVLVADGPGRLSAESARAMCRADFIYTYKLSQGAAHDPLPAEFAAVFEVTDVPPFREYKKRRDWQKLLSE